MMIPVFMNLPGKLDTAGLVAARLVINPIGPGTNSSDPNMVAIFLIILLAIIIYSLPTFVAFYRKHPNRWPILLINVIFGTTVLGWFAALIWAMSAAHRSTTGNHGGESGLNMFINDPQRPLMGRQPMEYQADATSQLQSLKALLDSGVITEGEYKRLKNSVFNRL